MKQSVDQPPFQLPDDRGTEFKNGNVIDFRAASEHLKKTETQVIAERTSPIKEEIDTADSAKELQPLTKVEGIEVRGKVLQFFRREELEQDIDQQVAAA